MYLKRTRKAAIGALFLVALTIFGCFAGRILITDNKQPSDVMVVLGGDIGDVRLDEAVRLLNQGYAKELVIDGPDWMTYGRPMYAYAQDYAGRLSPNIRNHVHVCPFEGDSTQLELREIAPCMRAISPNATTGLLVTSTYHTRRALSVASRILPQYRWSSAAATDPRFGARWWQQREWAKTCITEWQKTLWWYLLERWKA